MSPTPERRLGNFRNADLAELRHRFRTPFRQILASAEILIEEASTLRSARALDLLRHIHSAGLAALNDIGQTLANRDTVELGEVELLSAKIRPRIDRILSSLETLDGEAGGSPEDWQEDIDRITASARTVLRMLPGAPAHHELEDPVEQGTTVVEAAAPRLLVVGSDTMERRVLCRRLQRQGYEAIEGRDASTALDMAAAEAFDVLLLDLMMPAMSSFELLERLKSDRRLHGLPVLVIAPFDETDRIVRALQMGAEDYLFKPLEPVMIKTRVNSQLERSRLREKIARLEKPAAASATEAD